MTAREKSKRREKRRRQIQGSRHVSVPESINMLMVEEGYDYPISFPAAKPPLGPVIAKHCPKVVPSKKLFWFQKAWWNLFHWCDVHGPMHRYWWNGIMDFGYFYVCYQCNTKEWDKHIEILEKQNED